LETKSEGSDALSERPETKSERPDALSEGMETKSEDSVPMFYGMDPESEDFVPMFYDMESLSEGIDTPFCAVESLSEDIAALYSSYRHSGLDPESLVQGREIPDQLLPVGAIVRNDVPPSSLRNQSTQWNDVRSLVRACESLIPDSGRECHSERFFSGGRPAAADEK
jgi:hypothetical protein